MMRKYLLVLLFLNCIAQTFAQEEESSNLYLTPQFVLTIPLNSLHNNKVTDPLLNFRNHQTIIKPLAVYYFLNNKLGVYAGVGVQAIRTRDSQETVRELNINFRNKYGTHYHILSDLTEVVTKEETDDGELLTWDLGIAYRNIKNKKLILFKMSAGKLLTITGNEAKTFLKERNSNRTLEFEFSPNLYNRSYFFFSTSALLGYKIAKRFYLNMELYYRVFPFEYSFKERMRNTFTEEITARDINYNKTVHNISIGLGVVFVPNFLK